MRFSLDHAADPLGAFPARPDRLWLEVGSGGGEHALAQAAANPANASSYQLPSFPVEYREGADVGYRWYEKGRLKPLFPFGHGLSYTGFAYRNPVVTGGRAGGM